MTKAQVVREIGKTELTEALTDNKLRVHHVRKAFNGSRNTRVFFLTVDVAAYLIRSRTPVKRRKTPPLEMLAWAATWAATTLLLASIYDNVA